MTTIRNNNNGNYAIIVNKGEYGFTVHFGYTVLGNDTCTGMKVFKSEKTAIRKANEYVN